MAGGLISGHHGTEVKKPMVSWKGRFISGQHGKHMYMIVFVAVCLVVVRTLCHIMLPLLKSIINSSNGLFLHMYF